MISLVFKKIAGDYGTKLQDLWDTFTKVAHGTGLIFAFIAIFLWSILFVP
jgi:hypothetical protein